MAPTVWTMTFSAETFGLRAPGRAYLPVTRQVVSETIEPGDVIVPYVVGSGWVGIWEVLAKALPGQDTPLGARYSIVIPVEEIVTLKPTDALRPSSLPLPSSLRQQGGVGQPMPYLFQGAGCRLAETPGRELRAIVKSHAERVGAGNG